MDPIDVTVYYLEMLTPSRRENATPRGDLTVRHVASPAVPFYRHLYDSVGSDYHWLSRRKLSDQDLARVLGDPRNELHVLNRHDAAAGFAELDRRCPNEIELVQFGLLPGFIGQGIGKRFLQWTIDRVWSYEPRRFWLHTCSLDHPAASPNYLKAGFRICKRETIRREL